MNFNWIQIGIWIERSETWTYISAGGVGLRCCCDWRKKLGIDTGELERELERDLEGDRRGDGDRDRLRSPCFSVDRRGEPERDLRSLWLCKSHSKY